MYSLVVTQILLMDIIMNMAIEIMSFPSRNDCFLQLWQFNRGYLLGKPEAVNGLIAMAMCNHISSYPTISHLCLYLHVHMYTWVCSKNEHIRKQLFKTFRQSHWVRTSHDIDLRYQHSLSVSYPIFIFTLRSSNVIAADVILLLFRKSKDFGSWHTWLRIPENTPSIYSLSLLNEICFFRTQQGSDWPNVSLHVFCGRKEVSLQSCGVLWL